MKISALPAFLRDADLGEMIARTLDSVREDEDGPGDYVNTQRERAAEEIRNYGRTSP